MEGNWVLGEIGGDGGTLSGGGGAGRSRLAARVRWYGPEGVTVVGGDGDSGLGFAMFGFCASMPLGFS